MRRLHTDLGRGEVAVDATRGRLMIVCLKIDPAPQIAPGRHTLSVRIHCHPPVALEKYITSRLISFN